MGEPVLPRGEGTAWGGTPGEPRSNFGSGGVAGNCELGAVALGRWGAEQFCRHRALPVAPPAPPRPVLGAAGRSLPGGSSAARGSRRSSELRGWGEPPHTRTPPPPSPPSGRCAAGPQGQMAGEALRNPRLPWQVNAEAEIPFALTFNHNRSFYLRAWSRLRNFLCAALAHTIPPASNVLLKGAGRKCERGGGGEREGREERRGKRSTRGRGGCEPGAFSPAGSGGPAAPGAAAAASSSAPVPLPPVR